MARRLRRRYGFRTGRPAAPLAHRQHDAEVRCHRRAAARPRCDHGGDRGYRYTELYFAGADRNWAYASYQADKLKTAPDQGLVRRPKRAASAQPYLSDALPAMQVPITAQDSVSFNRAFEQLTTTCNTCHEAEAVASFTVRPPRARLSPIRN